MSRPRPSADAAIVFSSSTLRSGAERMIRGLSRQHTEGLVQRAIQFACELGDARFGQLYIFREQVDVWRRAVEHALHGAGGRLDGGVTRGTSVHVRVWGQVHDDGRRAVCYARERRDGTTLGAPICLFRAEIEALERALDWLAGA
jgi:hypothetical protein